MQEMEESFKVPKAWACRSSAGIGRTGRLTMADSDSNLHPPIIIRKKHAGHAAHGGAWKVAYADFVTAMMALFHRAVADVKQREGKRRSCGSNFLTLKERSN